MPPNVNDSTKSTMPAAESPSTGNPSTETDTTATVPQPAAVTPPAPHCVRVKFDLEFNLTYTTIGKFEIKDKERNWYGSRGLILTVDTTVS